MIKILVISHKLLWLSTIEWYYSRISREETVGKCISRKINVIFSHGILRVVK